MMHSVHHGMCPAYLADTVSAIADNPTRHCLRSAVSTLYRLPRCRTSMGERAFSFSGPLTWNALPSTLRDIADRTRFRKLLKTHFFNSLAFYPMPFCNACLDMYVRQAIELRVLLLLLLAKLRSNDFTCDQNCLSIENGRPANVCVLCTLVWPFCCCAPELERWPLDTLKMYSYQEVSRSSISKLEHE